MLNFWICARIVYIFKWMETVRFLCWQDLPDLNCRCYSCTSSSSLILVSGTHGWVHFLHFLHLRALSQTSFLSQFHKRQVMLWWTPAMGERKVKSPEHFTFHLRKNILLFVMIIEVFKCSVNISTWNWPYLYIGLKEDTNANVAQMDTTANVKPERKMTF